MEVMSTKGSTTGYKIAYLSKPITASTETDQNARNEASQFAGKSRDEKSFNENYEKELKPRNINKGLAIDIFPASGEIPSLGVSRALVRKIYDAKRGEVLQPERVGDRYIVALVTEVNEEGTQPASKARAQVEPLLRNRKKAEAIKKQLGTISSLEAVSTTLGKPVEVADSLRMLGNFSQVIGFEPKVIGAAFNPNNRGKVVTEAIEGSQGVYVIRVDNVTATALGDANVAEQRESRYNAMKGRFQQLGAQIVGSLREAANITDNRAKHY